MRARSVLLSLLVVAVVLVGAEHDLERTPPDSRALDVAGSGALHAPNGQPVRMAGIDVLPDAARRIATEATDVARRSPVVFFGLFVAGVLVFLPGSTFTIAAGLSYGIWAGLMLSVAASVVAAVIHFSLARYLLRGRIRHRLRRRAELESLDRALDREGWKIVGFTRASSVIPGAVQSCLYALTSVPFRSHLLASVVGLIPPTLFYVAVGAAGGDALTPGDGALARSGAWVLLLVPLFVALWYLTREARRVVGARAPGPASRGLGHDAVPIRRRSPRLHANGRSRRPS